MATAKSFTQRDKDCLIAYFSIAKTQSIDWKTISKTSSFTTDKYARDTFNAVKKKLNAGVFDLTSKQMELLKAIAVNSSTSSVDWSQVAKVGKFTTAKYARDSWAGVKNKLMLTTADAESDTAEKQDGNTEDLASKSVKEKTETPRKRKAAASVLNEANPSKKKKIGEAKKSYQAVIDDAKANDDKGIEF